MSLHPLLLLLPFLLAVAPAQAAEPDGAVKSERQTAAAAKKMSRGEKFLRDMHSLQQASERRSEDNRRRSEALDMTGIVSAATLASPAAVTAGRIKLAKMRALEEERLAIGNAFRRDARGLVTPEVEVGMGPVVLDQFNSNLANAQRQDAALTAQRLRAGDAAAALLLWASKQRPPLQEKGGKLLLASPGQTSEFNELIERFRAGARGESAVLDIAERDRPEHQKKYDDAMQVLKEADAKR